jgi:hypothetical protein
MGQQSRRGLVYVGTRRCLFHPQSVGIVGEFIRSDSITCTPQYNLLKHQDDDAIMS